MKNDTNYLKTENFKLDKNSFLPILFLVFLLVLISIKSWGQFDQTKTNENFLYPAGNLLGQSTWTQQGTDATNPIQVTSPGLFFPGYQSSGIGLAASLGQNATGQDLFRNFTLTSTISSGSIYITALVKVSSASRAGDYFLSFKETTSSSLTVFKGRLYAKDSLSGGNLVFGVTKSASSGTAPVSWTPQYFSFNTTYLVVMKYTFVTGSTTNDLVDLYVFDPANPFPVTEPTPNATASDAGTDGVGQRCVQLRQGAIYSPVAVVDGIRIGAAWADVVTHDIVAPVAVFTPANGTINVLTNIIPKISFNEPVRKTDGTPLTNSDLASIISFKTTNSSGTPVPFTANIDDSCKNITITPVSPPLLNGQLYYLAVAALEDGAGNEAALQSSTFTTIPATLSNDATLSDLRINGVTIPGFSPTIYSYNDTVYYGLPSAPPVAATTNFPLATFVTTNASSMPGTTTVVVTAQNGTTQLTYSVHFIYAAASINSKLSYIKWLPNGLDPVKQNIRVMDFNSVIFDYEVEVPSETNSLVVDAEPAFVIPATGCPPATYVVTQPVNLTGTHAERTATVVCTAQDGIHTSTYNVTFTKASGSNIYLYKEGFNTMPPAGWTNTTNVGSSTGNGMGFYGSTVTFATPKFKWLSPTDGGTLTTPASNGAGTLQFFVKVLDKNPASNLHLYIEKSYDNSIWTLVSQDPLPLYVSISQWHQVILTVNDNNPQVYFRFRASATTGDNSTGLFYIDDVSLTAAGASSKTLGLTLFLEGFYNGSGGMNQAQQVDADYNSWNAFTGSTVDTLSVLLRNASEPWDIAYEAHAVNISTDGTLSLTDIPTALAGSYYIVIKHRSTVEAWSANPVDFSGSVVSYNFTTSADQAYGSTQVDLGGGVFGLYSGDVDGLGPCAQDGYVEFFDLNAIYNVTLSESFYGYQCGDLNGDGFIEFLDLNLVYNNGVLGRYMDNPIAPLGKRLGSKR
jgi:hypothetical protein